MHVALALVVAVATVGCASVSQVTSPPEGDPTVDLAEAPSASTDAGNTTAGPTGDLAPAPTSSPPPWQVDLPPPPFSWWVTVAVPTQTTVCQPSCRTQRGTAQLAVRVAVTMPGVVELTFNEGNTRTLTGVSPSTGAFTAGAGYTTSTGWGHWNVTGHVAPGRLLVIDTYSKAYQYEVGMFDSWSDDAVSIGAGQARF